jgi:ABC-type antimicrobial peptide transport system permease subunit
MFVNLLKITLRNLAKNRSYLLVNVLGLTLGITCALMLFVLLRFQFSTDTFHQDADQIYRVLSLVKNRKTGEEFTYSQSPTAFVHQLRALYPQLGAVTVNHETWKTDLMVVDPKTGERKKYQQSVTFTDPAFFSMFHFPFAQGEAKTALSEPNTVVLSEQMAKKLFGSEPATGRIVRWANLHDLRVTGIVKDFPANTDFPFEFIISDQTRHQGTTTDHLQDWRIDWSGMVFVKLPPGTSPEQLAGRLSRLNSQKMAKENLTLAHQFQPLADVHWDLYRMSFGPIVPKFIFFILAGIGTLLILTACINFVNLATAQALNRAREVGIRKVMGSSRPALMAQFMGEALLVASAALGIAWLGADYFLSLMNNLLHYRIDGTVLTSPTTVGFMFGLLVVVTFLSGFYPALVLSGFNPLTALKKGSPGTPRGGMRLRKGLVVVQFTISQLMIIFSVIMARQASYLKNRDLGFDKKAVVSMVLPKSDSARLYTLKDELLRGRGVRSASLAFAAPSAEGYLGYKYQFMDAKGQPKEGYLQAKPADTAYLATFGIELLAGRNLHHADTLNEIVVNELMTKQMGFGQPEQALGASINIFDDNAGVQRTDKRIVGVVKDFVTNTLRNETTACIIATNREFYYRLHLKIDLREAQPVFDHIEKTWNRVYPEYFLDYAFVDERIAAFYELEDRFAQLINFFTAMTIMIGCIGLYGLVSFMALQRTKEIGVRKVLGASVLSILLIFSREFVVLLAIAFVMAAPIGYAVLEHLVLVNYANRITIGASIFLITFSAALGIALLTVGYRSLLAATQNPARSLRTE